MRWPTKHIGYDHSLENHLAPVEAFTSKIASVQFPYLYSSMSLPLHRAWLLIPCVVPYGGLTNTYPPNSFAVHHLRLYI